MVVLVKPTSPIFRGQEMGLMVALKYQESRILYLEHGTSKLSRYVKAQEFISLDLGPLSCPQTVKEIPLLT